MHVVVSIVAWNSLRYLPGALASLEAQTFTDWTLVVVDNASMDGVEDFVRANHPRAAFIRNTKNLGFARGHNQAIAYAKARIAPERGDVAMLVMNPDIVLEPTFLTEAVAAFERRPEAGSMSGKLLRMIPKSDGVTIEGEKTHTIDSAGIRVRKTRRTGDRGSGEQDGTNFDRTEEIFGPSGALGLYRLSALNDVAYGDEYFDDDMFAYKEDIDLAWRLRLKGWKSYFFPGAVAYHYRAARGKDGSPYLGLAKGRRGRSPLVRFLSYRNHGLLLLKNEQFANALIDLPRILWYETGKFLYALFTEPSTLRAIPSGIRLLPRILKKRHLALRGAIPAKEIRKWFK